MKACMGSRPNKQLSETTIKNDSRNIPRISKFREDVRFDDFSLLFDKFYLNLKTFISMYDIFHNRSKVNMKIQINKKHKLEKKNILY